jgi:hypothetical protein
MKSRKKKPQKRWTKWRAEFLKKTYKELETEHLVELFGVSSGAIQKKAQRLKVLRRKVQRWEPGEILELRKLGKPITAQVARLFNRSPGAVRGKLRELQKEASSASTE